MRALVIALVIAALTGSAAAERKAAERYFRAGQKAYRAQNFGKAAENFELALKEMPIPEIAFSAAQAYRKQFRVETKPLIAAEHAKRAVTLYRAYLDKVKTGGRVADAIDSLAEMVKELDRLGVSDKASASVAAERGTGLIISVLFADQATASSMREVDDETAEPETKVVTLLDGKPVPPDERIDVEPTEHVVRAEAPGYIPQERRMKAAKGEPNIVEITLEPQPARVTVRTEDDAQITVDGRAAGTTPLNKPLEMKAGTHYITLTRRGRNPVSREVTVKRGDELPLVVPLEKTLQRRAAPWVFGASGALALFTLSGFVGWVKFENTAEDRKAELDRGNQDQSVLDAYNSALTRRDQFVVGMLVAGGATVAVAGIGLALIYFDTPSAEGTRVTPMVTSDRAGAVISGRF